MEGHLLYYTGPVKNRDYKTFAPGEYYHIYNRGNGKMDIFRDQSDYQFFLSRLKEYLFPEEQRAPSPGAPLFHKNLRLRKSFPTGSFTLISYCLMPNHFHFLIRQNGEIKISELMLSLIGGYSKYFNKKYKRVGSVFQDQFKSVHIDSNEYLLWLSAYIHQNPKVAAMVQNLSKYSYSNYSDCIGLRNEALCDPSVILEQYGDRGAYQNFVESSFGVIKNRKDLEHLLLD